MKDAPSGQSRPATRLRRSTAATAGETRLRAYHTTTVRYTGDNNVTYTKTCEPTRLDISIQSIEPVYLPEVRHTTDIQAYTYPYEYYPAGPSRVTAEDEIHRCVHCETSGGDETYTYCPNCGAIACTSHTKTERLDGGPVCTGCAVTERFALKMKYFYDDQNLEAFREEYSAMPIHEKATYDVETWEGLEQSLADGDLTSAELRDRRDVITRWEESLEDRRLIKHALALYSDVEAVRPDDRRG